MKYETEPIVKINEYFRECSGTFFYVVLRKSYSPDRCTFQFELGIMCMTIDNAINKFDTIVPIIPLIASLAKSKFCNVLRHPISKAVRTDLSDSDKSIC